MLVKKQKKHVKQKNWVITEINKKMVKCGVILASQGAWALYAAPSLTLGVPRGGSMGFISAPGVFS